MAVTRGATTSSFTASSNGETADISHTVDVGTTLLIVSVSMEAGENIVGTPQWSLGGGENLTLINATTASGSNSDMREYTYGLVSPTAGAGTVDIVITTTDNVFSCAINYIGTIDSTVAAATNFLSEDVNDAGTGTTVHASAGTAGNALYFAGCFKGGDGTPVSNASGFTELFENVTGSSPTADHTFYVADLLNNAPAAFTATWTGTDENAGHYIEIVSSAAGNITESVPFGSLTLTGVAPLTSITGHVRESIPNGSLVLSGIAPLESITGDVIEPVPNGLLNLTGFAPLAKTPNKIEPVPSGSLTLTGFAPLESITGHVRESIPPGSLLLTGFPPTDYQTGHVRESIPNGTLSLAGIAPLARVAVDDIVESIPSGSLTLSGVAPAISTGNVTEPILPGSLTLTSFAPITSITGNVIEPVGNGAITLTSFAPVSRIVDDVIESIPNNVINITGLIPIARTTAGIVEQPPSAAIQLTTFRPNVRSTFTDEFLGNRCIDFVKASSQYASMSDADFGSYDSQVFTVSFFFQLHNLTDQGGFCGQYDNAFGDRSWYIAYGQNGSGTITFSINNESAFLVTAIDQISDLNRHHLQINYNSLDTNPNDRIRMILDGIELSGYSQRTNPALGANIVDSAADLTIGAYTDGVLRVAGSTMDEWAFVSGNNPDNSLFQEDGVKKNLFGISGLKSWTRFEDDLTDQILPADWTNNNGALFTTCPIIVPEPKPVPGHSRYKHKHRSIMIDGRKYTVDYPEQEYFLLQRHLDKLRSQYILDLVKKKTPQVKRKIKINASKIKRIENRIDRVSEEMKWRQKIQKEDEEILTLLAVLRF